MPSVMRCAPSTLYNSFQDVHKFVMTLYEIFQNFDGKLSENSDNIVNEMNGEDSHSAEEMPISARSSPSATTTNHSSDSEPDSIHGTNTL
jgi:hypothetical protein